MVNVQEACVRFVKAMIEEPLKFSVKAHMWTHNAQRIFGLHSIEHIDDGPCHWNFEAFGFKAM